METLVKAEILMQTKPEESSKKMHAKIQESENQKEKYDIYNDEYPPKHFVWTNIIIFVILHFTATLGFLAFLFGQIKWQTFLFAFLTFYYGSFGVTGGSHRLWSHKCYKAKLPLKIFLAIGQTVALQNSIWEWSRDHRVHHKYTETLADPHNAKRGFFFSHMGWLMVRKHPAVIQKGKQIDMSDLDADPVVMFQKRYYLLLAPVFCFILPTLIPWYFWGESFLYSYCFSASFRYTLSLHLTWTINSVAHLWGTKPYDKNIGPVECDWAWLTTGEGWHNYHHTFPWDYKAAEFGGFLPNSTAYFIDQFAKIGWAYDLKTVPLKIIEQRIKRTGDGTHIHSFGREGHNHPERAPCAWGDTDIPPENVAVTKTLFPKKAE